MRRLNLDEVHNVLLDILIVFDEVCRAHDLKYSLAAGTLLGAVRHKGFIPWDDDIDVYMPRPDYEKFIKIVSEENILPDYLKLSKDRGSGTNYCFVKVFDTRYQLRCGNHVEVPHPYLDIFPLDGVPVDREEREKLYKKEKFWMVCSGICQWYTMDRWWGFIAYVLGFWFYLLVKLFIGRKRAVRKMNEYARRIPFEESEMAAFHNVGKAREAIPTKEYYDLIELEFEGKMFYCVRAYDLLLRNTYGDYMQLPPKNKQRTRHYVRIYQK